MSSSLHRHPATSVRYSTIWSKSGNQGDSWHHVINLTIVPPTHGLAFEYLQADGWGEPAIGDVTVECVRAPSPSPPAPPGRPPRPPLAPAPPMPPPSPPDLTVIVAASVSAGVVLVIAIGSGVCFLLSVQAARRRRAFIKARAQARLKRSKKLILAGALKGGGSASVMDVLKLAAGT